jgi:hypothetical protein
MDFLKRLFFGKRFARVKNAQESMSMSVGECIATFTDPISGDTISFAGDTFYNEDELLGEITMKTERGERFMSADGTRDVVMQSLPRAGDRDITFLYGSDFDKLLSWGQRRIQPIFNFDFYFKYDTASTEGARIHRHKRCFFLTPPIQSIARGKGYVTAKISFGDIAVVDPSTGAEI